MSVCWSALVDIDTLLLVVEDEEHGESILQETDDDGKKDVDADGDADVGDDEEWWCVVEGVEGVSTRDRSSEVRGDEDCETGKEVTEQLD